MHPAYVLEDPIIFWIPAFSKGQITIRPILQEGMGLLVPFWLLFDFEA